AGERVAVLTNQPHLPVSGDGDRDLAPAPVGKRRQSTVDVLQLERLLNLNRQLLRGNLLRQAPESLRRDLRQDREDLDILPLELFEVRANRGGEPPARSQDTRQLRAFSSQVDHGVDALRRDVANLSNEISGVVDGVRGAEPLDELGVT